jgi:hypothetical protein
MLCRGPGHQDVYPAAPRSWCAGPITTVIIAKDAERRRQAQVFQRRICTLTNAAGIGGLCEPVNPARAKAGNISNGQTLCTFHQRHGNGGLTLGNRRGAAWMRGMRPRVAVLSSINASGLPISVSLSSSHRRQVLPEWPCWQVGSASSQQQHIVAALPGWRTTSMVFPLQPSWLAPAVHLGRSKPLMAGHRSGLGAAGLIWSPNPEPYLAPARMV